MKRLFLAPALGALIFATATPAFAQWGGTAARRPSYEYGVEARRIGYDNGFREGFKEGEKDGRGGDRYRYQDERDFERADVGYRRTYGDINLYRQAFRAGFADGYDDGYRRYSRNGRYGDVRRNDRGGWGGVLGGIFGRDDRRGDVYGRQGYYSVAFENGLREGLEKGREDIRKNRSFDPHRHEWYRDGDRHYSSRYGSRDQYKNEYRRGFVEGYDQGYQERYGRYR